MTIEEIQQQIIEEMDLFDDWTDKYEYIIELGKSLKTIAEDKKIDSNKIKGCQSNVWLDASFEDGKVQFTADSDALIVKGLVSLVLKVFSNQTPQHIIHANLDFIEKTGLSQHLAQTRSNGLLSMVKQIKFYAMAYSVQGTKS
jgi:cysteine desulfuration protein SufE